jgi:hypothetical protein
LREEFFDVKKIAKLFARTNRYRIPGFIFCIALFIGCFHGSDDKKTIIKGHIEFPVSDKIYFYSYRDTAATYLETMSVIDSSLIDKNGNYAFSLSPKILSSFNLVSGGNNLATNLFITPGEKIILNFIGKNNQPEFFPSGEAAKFNSYLVKFIDTFYKVQATKQEYYIATNYMDINAFASYNETRKQKQLEFFNSFFKYDPLKKDFKDYALNSIYYSIAADRLMYLWKKRMKGETVTADSSYFSFATPSFIENKNALLCPSYIRFLNLYIKDTFERMVERGELPLIKSEKLIPQVEKYKLALRLLKKPYCDVVLYNIIVGDLNDVAEKNHASHSSGISLDSLTVCFINKYGLN